MKSIPSLHPYGRLAAMGLVAFIVVYALLYARVDRFQNATLNLNQAYLAALVVLAFLVVELLFMARFYPRVALNAAIVGASVVLSAMFLYGIREQARVDDAQLARALIPHQAAALLMCREAHLVTADARAVCQELVASHSRDHARLRALLGE